MNLIFIANKKLKMSKKEKEEQITYSTALAEVSKLTRSLQKSLHQTMKILEETPEDQKKQSRLERRKAEYKKAKIKYRFTNLEKSLFLNSLIDIGELDIFENIDDVGSYTVENFILEHVSDFREQVESILVHALSSIEDLLPACADKGGKK